MPIAGAPNPIDIQIQMEVDKAVAETERFIREMDATKAKFKATQAELDRQAKISEEAAKKNTMSWTDFRSAYQTVLDVVKVGVAIWEETGQKFIDNAIAVGDLARLMGTTTEEASRLKEVSDDVGISFESVARAMKIAEKDGFQPGIAGLKQMSDEYLALAPGVDRAQYLLDRFGKSGEDMGKILEKGSDSIEAMSAAINDNMIVTKEAYKQAREYNASIDALKDSWDGLTYEAAPPLISAVTRVTDGLIVYFKAITDANPAHRSFGESVNWAIEQVAKEKAALLDSSQAANDATGAFETQAEAQRRMADEAKAAEQAIKDITKANQEYLSLVGDMTGTIEKHREKEAELQQQYNDGKITLDEYKSKWQELADEQELASRRMILNMLEQQLAVDGLSVKESTYLLETGLKWGVYSQEAVDAAKAAQEEVRRLTDDLNSIPTSKSISVDVFYSSSGYAGYGGGSSYATNDLKYQNQHASGGSFMIPQSYGNEGFRMGNNDTASGGELVTITPKGQGAGGMTLNILLDSATPDPEKVAYQLAPAIKRVLRQEGIASGR